MTSHQLKNPCGFFAPYIPMPKGRGFTARLVTLVSAYGSPTTPGNPYKFLNYGTDPKEIGNLNINALDLISETLSQAAAMVSLKRGLRGHLHQSEKAAIAKAALSKAVSREISLEEEEK